MTDLMTERKALPVQPRKTIWNPSPDELRNMAREMPLSLIHI